MPSWILVGFITTDPQQELLNTVLLTTVACYILRTFLATGSPSRCLTAKTSFHSSRISLHKATDDCCCLPVCVAGDMNRGWTSCGSLFRLELFLAQGSSHNELPSPCFPSCSHKLERLRRKEFLSSQKCESFERHVPLYNLSLSH